MGTDDRLSKEIEVLRKELNRSIKTRDDLKDSYEKSVELDKLMEQYIRQDKDKK